MRPWWWTRMANYSVEANLRDGEPWVALIRRSRAGCLKWRWDVYGVSFTPWPAFSHETATMAAVTIEPRGES